MAEGTLLVVEQTMDVDPIAVTLALMTPDQRRAYKENKIATLKKEKEQLIYQSMLQTLRIDTQKFYDEMKNMKQKQEEAEMKRNGISLYRNRSNSHGDSDYSSGSSDCSCTCSLSSSPEDEGEFLYHSSLKSIVFSSGLISNSLLNDQDNRFEITVLVIGREARPIVVSVTSNYTVIKIKEQLWGKIPARPSKQTLFYKNTQLGNDKIVSELGIVEKSVLYVSVRRP